MIAEILAIIIIAAASSYGTSQVLHSRYSKRVADLQRVSRAKIRAANERGDGAVHQVNLLRAEIDVLRGRASGRVNHDAWSGVAPLREVIGHPSKREPEIQGLEVSGFALTQPFEEFAATLFAQEAA